MENVPIPQEDLLSNNEKVARHGAILVDGAPPSYNQLKEMGVILEDGSINPDRQSITINGAPMPDAWIEEVIENEAKKQNGD